jgi:hypothetical protein
LSKSCHRSALIHRRDSTQFRENSAAWLTAPSNLPCSIWTYIDLARGTQPDVLANNIVCGAPWFVIYCGFTVDLPLYANARALFHYRVAVMALILRMQLKHLNV